MVALARWIPFGVPFVGALLNVGLNALNRHLESPFFLDSVFTAVVSAVFGLWPGLFTALLSQMGMEMVVTWDGAPGTAMPFVFCGLATALIVGTMAEAGRFRTVTQGLAAVVGVTLANALIGALVAIAVFGGSEHHAIDHLADDLIRAGQSVLTSAFWVRLPINLVDKGLAVTAAWWALRWCTRSGSTSTKGPGVSPPPGPPPSPR